MWPSFTVRILQDTDVVPRFLGLSRDSWAVLAQWATVFAISYAAWVAAHYQEKKDTLNRKQLMRNHLAALKLFRSSVEAYFYIVFDGSDLPAYYDSTSIIMQAREEFGKFKIKKEEIASVLPINAIEPFHNFLSYYKTVDQLSHEKDEDMYDAWKETKVELEKVISILEHETKFPRRSYIFRCSAKKDISGRKENN